MEVYDDSRLAPPDKSWHEEYTRWLHETQRWAMRLQQHPSFELAEDLGDYVETIGTLLSFAPQTRPDIVSKVMKEIHANDPGWAMDSGMTLEEIKALPMEEIRDRAQRAEEVFAQGGPLDEDDLACAALIHPELYDMKAHPETGKPVIHIR